MNKFRKLLPPLASLLPFEAAARLGSITRAGQELGLTQAAVSKQIKGLEQNLGTTLFHRRNRAIYLTDEGTELANVVVGALETISSCTSRMRDTRKSNEVVLFAQLCEGLYWVMPNLSKFYQRYPNIEVRTSVSTRPVTETTEYFDLALQTSCRNSGNCELIFSAPDEVFPVCSPDYLNAIEHQPKLTDLPNYRLLHHKMYPQDWINWDDWLGLINVSIRVGYTGMIYDSYPMMIQAAIEGHGIALGWRQTTSRLLQANALIKPFEESLKLDDGLSVYRHPNCKPRAEVESVLDWLREELLSVG